MKCASTCFFLLGILLGAAQRSLTCTCYGGPDGVDGNFQAADAVFWGKVKDLRVDKENSNALFEIKKSWKGVDTEEILVQSPANLCGYWFKEGESYIVYGSHSDSGAYTTNVCFRMVPVSHAGEDLAYLQTQAVMTLRHPLSVYWKVLIGIAVLVILLAGSLILVRNVRRKVA